MSSFGVPREHQQRVLIFGIAASLCLRAAFIALGAALLELLWSGTRPGLSPHWSVWVRKGFLSLRVPSPAVPDE